MMQAAQPSAHKSDVRRDLVKDLRQDILGPSAPDEEIPDSPLVAYLTGILYPQGVASTPEDDDSRSDNYSDEETDGSEISPSPSFSLRPSSIGLSCDVDPSVKEITVELSFGTYEKTGDKSSRPKWRRTAHSHTLKVDLAVPQKELRIESGVNVLWKVRPRHERNSLILSIFLINTKRGRTKVAQESLFQPSLLAKGAQGTIPFLHRSFELFPGTTTESEAESFNLLFRNKHEFAVGHGCSAGWDTENGERAGRVWTEILPTHETPRLEPFLFDMDGLDMNRLAAETKPSEMRRLLKPLADKYESWIESMESKVPLLLPGFQSTASANLQRCRHILERLRDGIEAVCYDSQSFEAFTFANRAMSFQLSRISWIAQFRKTEKRTVYKGGGGRWYPFQLAFILLNVRGIIDPKSEDRRVADLLWFPTGGGKTEAYLGLAAFVIAHRRLKATASGTFGGGVTALMRYTLRLLTIQQFQRAATLICSCELIRRSQPEKFGHEPILLGLWVGQAATPNTFEEAVEALHLHQTGGQLQNTPVQMQYCPWCGEPLSPRDYWADQDRHWILVECPRLECEFHGHRPENALPILTVDEDVYRRCPSLLIATVDKFARVAWNFRVPAIFGRVDKYCSRHGYFTPAESHARNHGEPGVTTQSVIQLPPPELIIQDELHLITGPLGTMVGLYEAAIDYLCCLRDGQEVIPPKVVASTATIRRAGDQINRLFARETSLFPQPAIDSSDTFFAKEISIDDRPGRLYVGVCAPGRSLKFSQVWIFASLLQHCESMRSRGDEVDPYWTLVGYFNSLRELGGALRLTEDDIPKIMGYIARGQTVRSVRVKEELTSRVGSAAIPDILARLELGVGSPSVIDILIATNMLSVGVDIQRLGLMVIDGQPKSTSEYLQATSRVGRKSPGLIVILYNWVRPRDMSHYERFHAYHSMLYRHVDAASLTPFAPRARDRGLRAIFVAMARILDPVLMDNKGAQRFTPSRPVVAEISHVLEGRAALIDASEGTQVREEIKKIIDRWEGLVNTYGNKLVYVMPPFGGNASWQPMLKSPEETSPTDSWPAPDSLRNVEKMANIYYYASP